MNSKFDRTKVEKALSRAAISAVSGPPEAQSGLFTSGADVILTRRERLRRVVLVCCLFSRNLAYYRVGQEHPEGWKERPLHDNANFWRTTNSNFIDVCVLEWCKLFGDCKGQHHWKKIVTDPTRFERELLAVLNCDNLEFESFISRMRKYRDKFLAHLDSDMIMQIPTLDLAKASVEFYHGFVTTHEARLGELSGLPDTPEKFRRGVDQCIEEAESIYVTASLGS